MLARTSPGAPPPRPQPQTAPVNGDISKRLFDLEQEVRRLKQGQISTVYDNLTLTNDGVATSTDWDFSAGRTMSSTSAVIVLRNDNGDFYVDPDIKWKPSRGKLTVTHSATLQELKYRVVFFTPNAQAGA